MLLLHGRAEAFRPGGPWRSLAPAARAQLIWRIGELIDRNADELAELETRDQGQPIGISRNVSVAAAAEHFRYYAGWVTKIAGETNALSFPATLNYTLREPIGVCGLIIPWNFPLMIAAWKLAPALACGEHVRREARRADAADRAAPRGADRRGRHPRRRRRGRHRRPGGRRRARRASRRRQDLLHRLDRGRALGHQGVGRQLQARLARARRQESRRRLRRRTARRRGRRRAAGRAPQQRTGVRVLQPRLRAASRRGRVRRGSCVGGVLDDGRAWSRRGDAARSARHARASRERGALHPAGRRRGCRAALRRRTPRRRTRGRCVPHTRRCSPASKTA